MRFPLAVLVIITSTVYNIGCGPSYLMVGVAALSGGHKSGSDPKKIDKAVCETKTDFSIDDSKVIQKKTLDIRRVYQRVRRYNCSGKVISDKVETLLSPKERFSIEGQTFSEGEANIEFRAINRQTCSTTSGDMSFALFSFEKSNRKKKWITADMSPAFFTTQVVRGENMFDYKFTSCLKYSKLKDNSKICASERVLEEGTMVVDVVYKEKTRPGILEVEATGCK